MSPALQGWTALTQLARWKKNNGRDFIFYDSHPGFVAGHSAPTFTGMYCNEFRHATHIVVERAQRNICLVSFLQLPRLSAANKIQGATAPGYKSEGTNFVITP